MRASLRGQQELAMRVEQALALTTKKEAEMLVDAVITALEATLLNNLQTDGFTLKLSGRVPRVLVSGTRVFGLTFSDDRDRCEVGLRIGTYATLRRHVNFNRGKMAGTTRLELATSAVTGQRSNQLNYVPAEG
jgi:hypothetical protein